MLNKADFEVKNVVNFMGREGHGYNCTLFVRGIRAAEVTNAANGGMTDYIWFVDGKPQRHNGGVLQLELEAFAKTLPPLKLDGLPKTVPYTLDLLMAELVDRHEENKTLKRWCKTQTVYRLKTDAPDTCRKLGLPYSHLVAQSLRQKFGEGLEEIINESFLQKPRAIGARQVRPEEEIGGADEGVRL